MDDWQSEMTLRPSLVSAVEIFVDGPPEAVEVWIGSSCDTLKPETSLTQRAQTVFLSNH